MALLCFRIHMHSRYCVCVYVCVHCPTWVCVHSPAVASAWTEVVHLGSEACWDMLSLVTWRSGCRLPSLPAIRPCLSPSPSLPRSPSPSPCVRPGGCRNVFFGRRRLGGGLRSGSVAAKKKKRTKKRLITISLCEVVSTHRWEILGHFQRDFVNQSTDVWRIQTGAQTYITGGRWLHSQGLESRLSGFRNVSIITAPCCCPRHTRLTRVNIAGAWWACLPFQLLWKVTSDQTFGFPAVL